MRLKIGRLFSIDIYLHWTFILVPTLLMYEWRIRLGLAWPLIGILSLLVLGAFVSVLFHEYGHALAARRFGVKTRDILLTPIGGLARLEQMSRDPWHEFVITIAGPMVNFVFAFFFLILTWSLGVDWRLPERVPVGEQIVPMLMWINMALFLFNLIPAFPMDGGRILRSLLAMQMARRAATQIAVMLGQVLSLIAVSVGVYTGIYSLVGVGIFVFLTARSEDSD